MDRIKAALNYVISNFGPLVAFYLINVLWGFRAGVVVSMALTAASWIRLKWKRQMVSKLFYLSAAMVFAFGAVDLYFQKSILTQYESVLFSFVMSVIFASSLLQEVSLVEVLARDQGRTSDETTPDKTFFFRFYTIAWSFYYLIKTFVLIWITQNSGADAFWVRAVVGMGSFLVMMFFSVGIPHHVWDLFEKLRIFPSQRA